MAHGKGELLFTFHKQQIQSSLSGGSACLNAGSEGTKSLLKMNPDSNQPGWIWGGLSKYTLLFREAKNCHGPRRENVT